MKKAKSYFIVLNDKGLHTRPSAELVKCASQFEAEIQLVYKSYVVNAKSLLGVLMLAANRGAKVFVEAEGRDADMAVATLLQLASHQFYMRY